MIVDLDKGDRIADLDNLSWKIDVVKIDDRRVGSFIGLENNQLLFIVFDHSWQYGCEFIGSILLIWDF